MTNNMDNAVVSNSNNEVIYDDTTIYHFYAITIRMAFSNKGITTFIEEKLVFGLEDDNIYFNSFYQLNDLSKAYILNKYGIESENISEPSIIFCKKLVSCTEKTFYTKESKVKLAYYKINTQQNINPNISDIIDSNESSDSENTTKGNV